MLTYFAYTGATKTIPKIIIIIIYIISRLFHRCQRRSKFHNSLSMQIIFIYAYKSGISCYNTVCLSYIFLFFLFIFTFFFYLKFFFSVSRRRVSCPFLYSNMRARARSSLCSCHCLIDGIWRSDLHKLHNKSNGFQLNVIDVH